MQRLVPLFMSKRVSCRMTQDHYNAGVLRNHEVVGKGQAVIVDTWWQTENGGFLCSTVPAIKPMKPGSAGPGIPGIHPIIFDDEGVEIPEGSGPVPMSALNASSVS